jgi:hypothetical protein
MNALRMLAIAALVTSAACSPPERGETGEDGLAVGGIDSLPSPAAPGSTEPNLTTGPDGRAYLTWLEPAEDSTYALRVAALTDAADGEGDTWSAARTIARRADFWRNWADFPSLLVVRGDSAGAPHMAAHWLQRSGGGRYDYEVRVARSRDGGATWGPGVVPHPPSAGEHGFASLYAAGGDSIGVVWLDGRNFDTTRAGATREMMLASTTMRLTGSLGTERILDGRICDCCQTSMAVTARGPVVVFRDRSPDEIRDIAIVRLVDGAWTAPRPVHADRWHMESCPVNGPAVAADGDRVAVAWFTAARDTARVLVAFSDDAGATFGAPLRVDGGQPAGRVDVELDDAGGAVVTWIERTGGEDAEVRVRRVTRDGRLGAPAVVTASSAARASGFPRMTRAGGEGGQLVFAWTVPGAPSAIRVARTSLGGPAR